MSDSKEKCRSCKEPIDENDAEYVTNDGPFFPIRPKDEGAYCQSCIESDNGEPNATAIFIAPEGAKLKAVWGEHTIEYVNLTEDEDSHDFDWTNEMREASEVIETLARGTEWVSTDPWRGYYEMPRRVKKKAKSAAEWVKVANTWSPTIEDRRIGHAMEFAEFYKAQRETAGVAQLWVFARTSNVCAMGVEVYVKRDDEEKFREMVEAALGSYAESVMIEKPTKSEHVAAKVAVEA